jgi:hypothetical protein
MDWTAEPGRPRVSQTKVVFGLVVMTIGLLLLLDRLSWWGFHWNVPLWPWILIVIGITRFADRSVDDRGRVRGRQSAVWLMFIGAWGLLNEYRLFGVHYGHSWPFLLIGVGALMVWRSLDPSSCGRTKAGEPSGREP